MPTARPSRLRLMPGDQIAGGAGRTDVVMDTFVTILVAGHDRDPIETQRRHDAVDRAFGWFRDVEARCSRFDAQSELRALTTLADTDVPVSTLLFEALRFALAVAEETDGAFDPTVGQTMEARGFNRDYRTGEITRPAPAGQARASYRDVHLDERRLTVRVDRPLVLDLGAVAKGLAIDLAQRELAPFGDYAIDAGGDLYLAGRNPRGEPWTIGVRHPRAGHQLLDVLRVSDRAVCTSGDYERPSAGAPDEHHIVDPRTGAPAGEAVSATVIAHTALLADTLATAAFVLGPAAGIALIERHGAEGLVVSPSLTRHETRGYGQ